MVKRAARLIALTVVVLTLMATGLVAVQCPFAIDGSVRGEDGLQEFYDLGYSAEGKGTIVRDTELARDARQASTSSNIRWRVREFVRTYHLEGAHVLDVGSGSGYLQDV